MIGVIWSVLTGNPIARMLAKVAGIALAIVSFGAWQRRQGAQGQKAKQDLADAKETIKAHEVRDEVDSRVARDADVRKRLRDEWSE